MLTETQLDELLDNANRGAFLSPSNPSASFEARKAASATLAAMRTPITADALVQAGWNNDRDGRWSWRVDHLEFIIIEIVADDARLVCAVGHYPLPGCKTMHDLAELVRLLGGAK